MTSTIPSNPFTDGSLSPDWLGGSPAVAKADVRVGERGCDRQSLSVTLTIDGTLTFLSHPAKSAYLYG